jgi:chaperonin GroES
LLKSIKNNVILELLQKEKVTASGIVLTSADPEEVSKGKVLAIGDVVQDVKIGDTVLPNWNAAKKMTYDGQELYVVTEENIILIFED